jgi:hypothetical protein
MIKYQLECKNCNLTFDSWFANSKEFEKLKLKNLINCHQCHSKKIEKSLMAPKLLSKRNRIDKEKGEVKFKEINKKIREYQKFIKKNFDYVGENFAYEARSIHYNNKKKEKGIFGSASKEEIRELKEEGINTQVIPWIEDKGN